MSDQFTLECRRMAAEGADRRVPLWGTDELVESINAAVAARVKEECERLVADAVAAERERCRLIADKQEKYYAQFAVTGAFMDKISAGPVAVICHGIAEDIREGKQP